eukprot:tig00020996_g16932.t1
MAERADVSIMNLPDDLLLLVMEKLAAGSGTMSVLRGLASVRRRFQQLAHGSSSTLFKEPVFVSGGSEALENQPSSCEADSSLPHAYVQLAKDVSCLTERFGERIERLHLGPAIRSIILDGGVGPMASCIRSRALLDVLRGIQRCPNLTHLCLAAAWDDPEDWRWDFGPPELAALADLPAGFSLPRLRHLDLSGLYIPLPALRRLLSACPASLERLFLRGTRIFLTGDAGSGAGSEFLKLPHALELGVEGLDFPRLESLDVSDLEDVYDPSGLERLAARFPALRDLYVLAGSVRERQQVERLVEKTGVRRPGRLVVCWGLIEMDAASLRRLRAHFEGRACPRPEEARLDVPRLAVASLFRALYAFEGREGFDVAQRLVAELGVSPLLRLRNPINADPWAPPYFRYLRVDDESFRGGGPEGLTPLHALACTTPFYDAHLARKLIGEWKLAGFANAALCSGRRSAPLHLAAKYSPALLRPLLALGADPLCTDAKGATAMHIACKLGRADAAQALMEAAARAGRQRELLSARDGAGRTPLHCAVQREPDTDLVVALLQAGADPLAKDEDECTPLYIACRSGWLSAARALLAGAVAARAGPAVVFPSEGATASDIPAPRPIEDEDLEGYYDCDLVVTRLKPGAERLRSWKELPDTAALQLACDWEDKWTDAAWVLSEAATRKGGDEALLFASSKKGERCAALHVAVEQMRWPDRDIGVDAVATLLQAGADPLCRDAAGSTALHVACRWGQFDAARALLEAADRAGAAIDLLSARDGDGRNPLQMLLSDLAFSASSEGRSRIAAYVVESFKLDGPQLEALGVRHAFLEEARWGAELSVTDNGYEPLLHFAANALGPRSGGTVRALLDAGASLRLEDRWGRSALQSVALRCNMGNGARRRRAEEVLGVFADFAEERGLDVPHPEGPLKPAPRTHKRPRLNAPAPAAAGTCS